LVPIWISKPSAVFAKGQAMMPALLMSTSSRSKSARMESAKAAIDFRLVRSSSRTEMSAAGNSSRMPPDTASALFVFRAAMMTEAFFPASTRAASSPIPLVAPVITTSRPF